MAANSSSLAADPAAVLPARQKPAVRNGQPAARAPRPTTPALWPGTPPDPPLSEALLARLWAGQRFPASALVTTEGVRLRVLHPGLAGRGAGPDFRDAIISAPGRLLRGDVELHRRSSDFRVHGHHRDPRYDRLILHVVFADDATEATCVRAGGKRVPVVSLASWLERRTRELQGWLASPSLWREPCYDALARLGPERVRGALATLGDRRFAEREALLHATLDAAAPGESLYHALLSALSYGADRSRIEELADVLPWPALSTALAAVPLSERLLTAEALLLGAAGLLATPCDPDEAALSHLWLRSAAALGLPQHSAPPLARSFRPANHPARRLAGLAALIVRHERLLAGEDALREALSAPAAQLAASWSVPASGYWREHTAPGMPSQRPPGALIGRGRAIELLVNAVLPWSVALAEQRGESELAAAAHEAFARLPSPGRYGRLAFLETNVGADGTSWRLDARLQQGLLALYKTECTQGGCGRCPLS